MRVPEYLFRIYHLFDRSQSRVSGRIIIQAMCLCRREARVNVIQVGAESGLRLSVDESIVQPVDEGGEGGRKRRGQARVSVVLNHPKTASVGVGRRRRRRDVDLGVRPTVKIDDGEPRLFELEQTQQPDVGITYVRGIHTVLDDVIKKTGQSTVRQGCTFRRHNALGILQFGLTNLFGLN